MNNLIYKSHFIRKRFGQIFLTDKVIIDHIVSIINPKKYQTIIEIGPGLAALTEPVSKRIDHLIVIELDKELANRLKTNPVLSSKLTVYQQDVMTVNFKKFFEKTGQMLRLFGNLPYNISTKLIFYLSEYRHIIFDMHFMLQKEVANRLIAKPNSKAYGPLSVMAQFYYKIFPILEVSKYSFTPQSKVDSKMVRLLPHISSPCPVKNLDTLKFIIKKAFNQRRKKICNSLNRILSTKELIKVGVDPEMRAENISVSHYCLIANYITEHFLLHKKK